MESGIARRTLAALTDFKLDRNHLQVWDPNSLVSKGFPAEVVFKATSVFKREDHYYLYYMGEPADEFIGVRHDSLVWEIARALDVDTSAAVKFTGHGFRMRAIITEIEALHGASYRDLK